MTSTDYNPSDIESIKKHAEKLLHKSLNQVLGDKDLNEITEKLDANRKGHLGNLVENYIFHIKSNNESAPDFPDANLELKTTPLKETKRKGLRAKERLVLSMINYAKIVEENWQSSAFIKKNANLLILFYLYRRPESILEHKFILLKLLKLLSDLPPADIQQIRKDWEAIAAKVKAGKAHELSEGDTFYLGACTKGATAERSFTEQPESPIKAKSRAFSLKQTYLNHLISTDHAQLSQEYSEILAGPKHEGIDAFVHERMDKYLGRSVEEIHEATGAYLTPGAKAFYADLARAMLGARKKKIAEFEKADVSMKIVRLKHSGTPKESMSFPAIDYTEIVKEDWEDSALFDILSSRKYLFIIYQYDKDGILRFAKHMFWNMPYQDLEGHARKVWERTKAQIAAGHADDLPKIKDDPVCHVRPHGKDSHDLAPTPYGKMVKKQSFWLNASYIREQINKVN